MHRVPGDKLAVLSPAERRQEIRKNHVCNLAKLVESCTNELHPNCMGFVRDQLRIRMLGIVADKDYLKNGMPQCVEYLFEDDEKHEEYPMFNKLVSELESIKDVLNNKNVV